MKRLLSWLSKFFAIIRTILGVAVAVLYVWHRFFNSLHITNNFYGNLGQAVPMVAILGSIILIVRPVKAGWLRYIIAAPMFVFFFFQPPQIWGAVMNIILLFAYAAGSTARHRDRQHNSVSILSLIVLVSWYYPLGAMFFYGEGSDNIWLLIALMATVQLILHAVLHWDVIYKDDSHGGHGESHDDHEHHDDDEETHTPHPKPAPKKGGAGDDSDTML